MVDPDLDLTERKGDPIALATAALLTLTLTVFSLFTDWLSREVPIPLGVLLLLFMLVVLPTGEVIGVIIAFLNATKREYKRGATPGPELPPGERDIPRSASDCRSDADADTETQFEFGTGSSCDPGSCPECDDDSSQQ